MVLHDNTNKRCFFLALHLKILQENCSKKTSSRSKAGRDCSIEGYHLQGRAHNCFPERLGSCRVKLKHYEPAVLRVAYQGGSQNSALVQQGSRGSLNNCQHSQQSPAAEQQKQPRQCLGRRHSTKSCLTNIHS